MAYRVFPSANDVGVASGLPGKIATETLMHEWMLYSRRSTRDRFIVNSGSFQVSQDTGSNLNIKVAVGWTIIDGYYVYSSAIDTWGPLPVNAAVHVYVNVATDGGNLAQVSGTGVTWNTTGTVPTPYAIEIAKINTSGGTVINANITDMREVDPRNLLGSYVGDATVDRLISIGFTASNIFVFRSSAIAGSQYIGQPVANRKLTPEITTRGFYVSGDTTATPSLNGNFGGPLTYNYIAYP